MPATLQRIPATAEATITAVTLMMSITVTAASVRDPSAE
jgi:hypothetical protein